MVLNQDVRMIATSPTQAIAYTQLRPTPVSDKRRAIEGLEAAELVAALESLCSSRLGRYVDAIQEPLLKGVAVL